MTTYEGEEEKKYCVLGVLFSFSCESYGVECGCTVWHAYNDEDNGGSGVGRACEHPSMAAEQGCTACTTQL
jgi:hypothetical protein